jgi:hypothetical protein
VQTFNSRLRDESLNVELFGSVPEARLFKEQYRMEYNTYRPHSALQQWTAAWLPTSSQGNWTSNGGHVTPSMAEHFRLS